MIISFEILTSLILLIFLKKIGIIYYELIVCTVYLIALSFIQTLDITFPIYIVFTILPFINKRFIKYKTKYIIPSVYLSVVLIFSIIKNGPSAALSIFLIRLSGILFSCSIFQLLLINSDNKPIRFDSKKLCFAMVICESIVFILGLYLSPDQRLMLNYQCTVGCIGTSTILFLIYSAINSKNKKIFYLLIVIISLIVIRSGTRGYILVTLATVGMAVLLFSNGKVKFFGIFIILLGLLYVLLNPSDSRYLPISSIIGNQFGINKGIGRRGSENSFIGRLIIERPLLNFLFGNGFGTSFGSLPETSEFLSIYVNSDYTYNTIYNSSGTHNMWATVFYSCGIIGFISVCYLYFQLFLSTKIYCYNRKIRIIIYSYLTSYAILLWFRWSATSGILEFFILHVILLCISKQSIE